MAFLSPTLASSSPAWSPGTGPSLSGPHPYDPWKDEETKPDNDAPAKVREEQERVRELEERRHEEHLRQRALDVMRERGLKTFYEALQFVRKGGPNGRTDEP